MSDDDSQFEEDNYFAPGRGATLGTPVIRGRGVVRPNQTPLRGGLKRRAAQPKEPTKEASPVPRAIPRPTPTVEKFPSDINLNVSFKQAGKKKVDVNAPDDERKVRYQIAKHIDTNRDLYFVKLVSGALKRKSFHTLIDVESSMDVTNTAQYNPDGIEVKVKYTYNVQLLHAWATVIEKVKAMIDPAAIASDGAWSLSEPLHRRIIEKDGILLAFARYVAFVMMTESNNLVPRNKTRYVIDDQMNIEDQRTLDLMRAVKKDFSVLKSELDAAYLRP